MTITDEAKTIISEALTSNGYDCLKAMPQQSCCGISIYFTLAKLEEGDKPISVNGVPVVVEDNMQDKLGAIKLQ